MTHGHDYFQIDIVQYVLKNRFIRTEIGRGESESDLSPYIRCLVAQVQSGEGHP